MPACEQLSEIRPILSDGVASVISIFEMEIGALLKKHS
jgi:hypothetical protein